MRSNLLTFAALLFAADTGAGTAVTDTATGAAPAVPEPFAYNEDRYFFTASDLEKGGALVNQIAAQKDAAGLPVYNVVSWSEAWPENAGLTILPLARNETRNKGTAQEETSRRCYAVLVQPFWGLDAVMSHPKGAEYLSQIIQADQAARMLNPMRKQDWEHGKFDASGCPKSLSDHIEGMAADGGAVKTYNEIVKLLLPSLKQMAAVFKNFTPAILRQYLSNAAVARNFAAQLEDNGFWLKIIDKLEAEAKARGMNAEIFQQWRDTRDQQVEVDLAELDLSSLSFAEAK